MKTRSTWGLPLALAVAVMAVGCESETGPSDDGFSPEPYVIEAGHLPEVPAFPNNPTSVPGVALGRRLFHDPQLSSDNTISCASCHLQPAAFGDPRAVSVGVAGAVGTRNAQPIVNAAWQDVLFWDGRATSLEDQAADPIVDPAEMNSDWPSVIAKLEADPDYPLLFEAAFGTTAINEDRVVQAIAQFERTLISNDSKFDRVQLGLESFTEAESRGHELFFSETGECFHCHASILFTDDDFHDIGLDLVPDDAGRQNVTGSVFDRGKMKTPTLRNVEVAGPYMHDGRFATLEEVLAHYAEGIQRSPNLDPLLGQALNGGGSGLALDAQDQADLVAFLKTLTDPSFLNNPEHGPPVP